MKKLSEKFTTFSQDFKNVHREAKKQGFVNIMKLLWKDLFVDAQPFNGSISCFFPAFPSS